MECGCRMPLSTAKPSTYAQSEFFAFGPRADIDRNEISQCSRPLDFLDALILINARAAPPEQFSLYHFLWGRDFRAGALHETARVHHACRWRGSLAAGG